MIPPKPSVTLSPTKSLRLSNKSATLDVVAAPVKKECDSSSIILALLIGREVTIQKHLYRIARKGDRIGSELCLYTGVYIKTTTSDSYMYSQFNIGIFIDFIERNIDACEITG